MAAMAAVCLCACSQQGSEGREDVIFSKMTNFDYKKNKDVKLSTLFKDYRLVQLETNDSCLIGGDDTQVVKHDGIFYVFSNGVFNNGTTITKFDNEGRFIGNFNRFGQGPEEYSHLGSFDVITRHGETEIWIATLGGINIYDANTSALKKHIPYKTFVLDFKYVNDSTIVFTNPDDPTFQVMDMEGKLHRTVIPKDWANLLVGNPNPFTTYQGNPIRDYSTQEAVVYDVESDSLYFKNIFPYHPDFVSIEVNQKYYEQYGEFEGMKNVNQDYNSVSGIRIFGEQAALILGCRNEPNKDMVVMLYDGRKSEPYCYRGPSASIENDIYDMDNANFFWTLRACNSDEGFLFYINAEDYTTDEAHLEDNPVLLEVSGFKL